MLHPSLDAEKKYLVAFRKSQKKFAATIDDTFSVVGHSMPYTFGRLNNEIVVLLSSLGIATEVFMRKQQEYFDWIRNASLDVIKGFEFLATLGKHEFAEKLFMYGFEREPTLEADHVEKMRRLDVLKEV